jgi:hypothetical protein
VLLRAAREEPRSVTARASRLREKKQLEVAEEVPRLRARAGGRVRSRNSDTVSIPRIVYSLREAISARGYLCERLSLREAISARGYLCERLSLRQAISARGYLCERLSLREAISARGVYLFERGRATRPQRSGDGQDTAQP